MLLSSSPVNMNNIPIYLKLKPSLIDKLCILETPFSNIGSDSPHLVKLIKLAFQYTR